jgi:hypothetical protein
VENPQTILFYQLSSGCCPPVTHEFGTGTIPSSDLRGDAGGTLILDTNTSAASNPNFNRLAGNGGPISVTWRANKFFVSRLHNNSRTEVGSLIFILNGVSDTLSAEAAGSAIGFVVSAFQTGLTGKSHSVMHTIRQGP